MISKMVTAGVSLLVMTSVATAVPEETKSGSLYSVKIESASAKAINYLALGGSATIDFRGTPLEPAATGTAKIKNDAGIMKVDASVKGLGAASKFGPEQMTYVLWAISPEGRTNNLGELVVKSGKGKISTSTRLQTFALVVTAEPYYAVTQVGNVVVLENVARGKDAEKTEDIRFDRLQRGQYTLNMNPADLQPPPPDKKSPPELFQARNAVKIAAAAGAEKYANESYRKAVDVLGVAEKMREEKKSPKKIAPVARQAVQTAEDARQFASKAQAEAKAEEERKAMAAKVSEAEKAKAAMEAEKAEAERARVAAQGQADKSRKEALDAQAGQQQAEQARQRAEAEKAQMREQLRKQLNAVLETQDTARGLIVNVSGLNFDTGKATLVPAVREKLARVSGILVSHPGLKIEVEGHTDSVGSETFNQKLSEDRASSVKNYLVESGVSDGSIVSRGFGKAKPVASNDDAKGRQQNRRVEIVVSGEGIAKAGS
jgi:outer membrane protein OmpA-like peptidoglycan-associated protein